MFPAAGLGTRFLPATKAQPKEMLPLAKGGSLDDPQTWQGFANLADADLWSVKTAMRERLVKHARERLRQSWIKRGASPAELDWIDNALDPNVLTIGFARRVPSYKRLTLMVSDPVRL